MTKETKAKKDAVLEGLAMILRAEVGPEVTLKPVLLGDYYDSVEIDLGYRTVTANIWGDGPLWMAKDVIRAVLREM